MTSCQCQVFESPLPVSDEVDWTSTPGAPVPAGAVAEEADADAEDIGTIKHKHVVRPELGEVAGPAVVEDEPEEQFQTPPAVPHYPIHEQKKLDCWKLKDWC